MTSRFGDRAHWGLGLREGYLLNPDLLLGLYCAAVPFRSSVGLEAEWTWNRCEPEKTQSGLDSDGQVFL